MIIMGTYLGNSGLLQEKLVCADKLTTHIVVFSLQFFC